MSSNMNICDQNSDVAYLVGYIRPPPQTLTRGDKNWATFCRKSCIITLFNWVESFVSFIVKTNRSVKKCLDFYREAQ